MSSFRKHSLAKTGRRTQKNRVTFNQNITETPFYKQIMIQDAMKIDNLAPYCKVAIDGNLKPDILYYKKYYSFIILTE